MGRCFLQHHCQGQHTALHALSAEFERMLYSLALRIQFEGIQA